MESLETLWGTFTALDGPIQLLKGVIYLAACIICGRVMRLLVKRARLRGATRTQESTIAHLLYAAQKPTEHALIVLGFYFFSEALPIVDKAHQVLNDTLFVLGVFCLARAASAAVRELVDGYARRVTERHNEEEPDVGVFQLLKKAGALVVWAVALMVGLHRFGIDIMSLGAALGVGSLAIGFAARETLGNMISGFTLLIDRPFREGDRVKLATQEVGDVREIGLRSTRIQLLDLSYLIVPNNELVNQRVVNLTYPSLRLRGSFTVSLAYGSDVARAKEMFLALAKAQPEVLTDPAPSVDVLQLADSGLPMEVCFFVVNQRRAGVVAEALRVVAHEKLREGCFEVAYPTRTIHSVVAAPAPAPAPAAPGLAETVAPS